MNIDLIVAGVLGGLITALTSLGVQALKNAGKLGAIRVAGDVRISSMERGTITKLLNDLMEERKAWQAEKEELLAEREEWRVEKLELQIKIEDFQIAVEAYTMERARYSREENKLRDKIQEFAIALAAREIRIKELEDRVLSVENGKPRKGEES